MRTLRADNPSPMTLDGTRTFVVGVTRPVVIDPGPADAAHLRAVLDALGGHAPVAILLTHAHADHSGGAAELARATGAPVRMAAGAMDPSAVPAPLGPWVEDGEVVETDAGTVIAVATPGHAPEHHCYLWTGGAAPVGGALFVGDLLMGQGDTTLVAPPEGDLAAYLRSLDRVDDLRPAVLHPAHGPPLTDPREAVARYREHRHQRIRQVREALAEAPGASPDALVDRIYGPRLAPALRRAAAGSLEAVLRYLER